MVLKKNLNSVFLPFITEKKKKASHDPILMKRLEEENSVVILKV